MVFLGTSLTAGLGLDPEQAYPALIQQKIDSAGLDYRVVNAGRERRDLRRSPAADRLAAARAGCGAGGGDRRERWASGAAADSLRANIQAVFDRARASCSPRPGWSWLACECRPTTDEPTAERFQTVYPELARTNGAELVPFLLEGVGGIATLNQADGIHPTAEGQRVMAETVWRVLEPVLREKREQAIAQRDTMLSKRFYRGIDLLLVL